MTTPRISLFLVPAALGDPATEYESALAAAQRAEALGLDGFWIAEGQLSAIATPSALALLAAASQRTRTIRLGTAVIPLAFSGPLQVAQTAAQVDWLAGHRLELGVGKSNGGGFSAQAFAAHGLDERDREVVYQDALAGLRELLEGGGLPDDVGIYPATGTLRRRIWQATSSIGTAIATGRAGDGLLLHRVVPGVPGADVGAAQRTLVDAYLDALPAGVEPRIGVSRVVVAADTRDDALAAIDDDRSRRPHLLSDERSVERYVVDANLHVGTPDDVARSLLADAAASAATDVLATTVLDPAGDAFARSLELLGTRVAPLLRTTLSDARHVTPQPIIASILR